MRLAKIVTGLFVPVLALSVFVELSAAAGAGSTFIDSAVCMSAPTLLAIVLTPTAKLGESLSNFVERRMNGGKS